MKTLFIALKIFLFFTLLTGLLYPLLIWAIAQTAFPFQANGSIIQNQGHTIGSSLIGQNFDTAIYFASRPSAIGYNPLPSGGSNYGLTNRKLKEQVADRRKKIVEINQLNENAVIPSEMLFASASGLDPHISLQAALLQANRIARARGFNVRQKAQLTQTIFKLKEMPQFLCLGEERINVLLLNLEIDKIR